jgi:hypothetical protein
MLTPRAFFWLGLAAVLYLAAFSVALTLLDWAP